MSFHLRCSQHLIALITSVDFTWPLKEDHMKLLRKYNNGSWNQSQCLQFPSDDPSSYVMVWDALTAMNNLRILRIDFLTTSSPLKYALRAKDLLPKWVDPIDDLLYEKVHTLELFSIWVPQDFFTVLIKVIPKQRTYTQQIYREVEKGTVKKGYFIFSRSNVIRIGPIQNHFSVLEEEDMWEQYRSSKS
jgi:hypothetical protein